MAYRFRQTSIFFGLSNGEKPFLPPLLSKVLCERIEAHGIARHEEKNVALAFLTTQVIVPVGHIHQNSILGLRQF